MGILDNLEIWKKAQTAKAEFNTSKKMAHLQADATIDILLKRLGRKKEYLDIKLIRLEYNDGRKEVLIPYSVASLPKTQGINNELMNVMIMVKEWYENGEYKEEVEQNVRETT